MGLQIKNQAAADALKSAIKSENFNDIVQKLKQMQTFDALAALLDMIKKNPTDHLFLGSMTMFKWKNTQVDFFARVVSLGVIPGGIFPGVGDAEYHAARWFIISMRDAEKDLTKKIWGEPRYAATRFTFFPEYRESDIRKRICDIAKAHIGKGPGMEQQGVLFSLGGMFGKGTAMGITKPSGGATTCILVARAVWHAAGINVIQKDTAFNVPNGLFAALPKAEFGYSPFTGGNVSSLTVAPGDIFHIQGDAFSNGNDSTHVGIIIAPAGDSWVTVEGGSGDHKTKTNIRKLVPVNSGKWSGRLTFEDDIDKTSAGTRPIVGWYSASKVNSLRLMQPAAATETMQNK